MQQGIKVYVHERGDRPGVWEVDVRGGSRGRSRKQFGSEAEAREFAAEVEHLARSKDGLAERPTVKAMVDGYLDSVRKRDLRPRSVQHRREMLAPAIAVFGADTLVREIANPVGLDRFAAVRKHTVKPATWRHHLWALRQAFEWAHAKGWITAPPVIEVPKMPPPRQEWLRSHEIEPFLDGSSDAFRPLAEAAIYFGLREGEVCVAQAGDFDLSAWVLWVREKPELDWKPKNGLTRGVPLIGRGRRIAEEIAKRPAGAWAWPNLAGERRVPGTWFSKATRSASEAAGITRALVFHDLRRTFGATMIEAGASMRAVQVALGHKSIRTTEQVYAPINNRFVADEMAKMDQLLERRASEHRQANPTPPARQLVRVVK